MQLGMNVHSRPDPPGVRFTSSTDGIKMNFVGYLVHTIQMCSAIWTNYWGDTLINAQL